MNNFSILYTVRFICCIKVKGSDVLQTALKLSEIREGDALAEQNND